MTSMKNSTPLRSQADGAVMLLMAAALLLATLAPVALLTA
jgi:hypothetical protein